MKKEQIVSQDPRVMHGTLVFAGTRVPSVGKTRLALGGMHFINLRELPKIGNLAFPDGG